jgi:hypothetical protein
VLLAGLIAATARSATDDEFIPRGARFSDSSEFGPRYSDGELHGGITYERGDLDGLTFLIHSNGRLTINGWEARCSTDKMTDVRTCLVFKEDVWVMVGAKGPLALVVGEQHSPGAPSQLRLDRGPVLTSGAAGWNGKQAAKVVAEASRATSITTRYTRWPNRQPTERVTSAQGLAGAVRIARWMVAARQ